MWGLTTQNNNILIKKNKYQISIVFLILADETNKGEKRADLCFGDSFLLLWFDFGNTIFRPRSLEFPNKWNYADFVRPGPFSMWLYLTHFYIWKSFPDKKQKFPDQSAASRHQTFLNETELRKMKVCVLKIIIYFSSQYQMTSPMRLGES